MSYVDYILSDASNMLDRMLERERRLRNIEVRRCRIDKELRRWHRDKSERERNASRLRVKHGR